MSWATLLLAVVGIMLLYQMVELQRLIGRSNESLRQIRIATDDISRRVAHQQEQEKPK